MSSKQRFEIKVMFGIWSDEVCYCGSIFIFNKILLIMSCMKYINRTLIGSMFHTETCHSLVHSLKEKGCVILCLGNNRIRCKPLSCCLRWRVKYIFHTSELAGTPSHMACHPSIHVFKLCCVSGKTWIWRVSLPLKPKHYFIFLK